MQNINRSKIPRDIFLFSRSVHTQTSGSHLLLSMISEVLGLSFIFVYTSIEQRLDEQDSQTKKTGEEEKKHAESERKI